jgi:two-component system invasion response regulator UvrY
MIRVLIADDHAIVRKGLREIVAETGEIEVVGEASDGHEAVSMALQGDYDVVLLDLSMPGKGGLAALKEIKTERPDLPVLVLSIHPENQYATRMLRAGASGYVTKDTAPEELIRAIRKVHKGGHYVSASLAESLAASLTGEAGRGRHENLSDREFDVMRKLASGKTVTQIAEELFLSIKTVSTYRARVMEKMGFSNNAELTRYAVENDLVE